MALDPAALEFLMTFLSTPAPARHEAPSADAFEAYAATFATTSRDEAGNRFARRGLGNGGPRIALCGHLDEVGLTVTEIDEQGYLRFATIGSWDPSVLVGQRVYVRGRDGSLVDGIVGRPGIHMLRATGAQEIAPVPGDLWLDIAVRSAEAAQELVEVGAPAVLVGEPTLVRGHIRSRSLDNRLGTFIALEVLRALPEDFPGEVIVVATVQEEVGGAGARATAATIDDVDAIVVIDLSPSSDTPVGHPLHTLVLGGGPGFNLGPANDDALVSELRAVAADCSIPTQLRHLVAKTSTDADRFVEVLPDTPCALVSLPVRYAHTPNELVALADVEQAIALLIAYATTRRANESHGA
jgi:endoglucanase